MTFLIWVSPTSDTHLYDNPQSTTGTPFRNMSHYNSNIPTCEQCDLYFPTQTSLDTHMRLHHKTVQRIKNDAVICENNINQLKEENHHALEANEEGRYQCTYCDVTSSKRYDLKLHMNIHTGVFKCEVCDVNLRTKSTLEKHRQTQHMLRSKLGKTWNKPL